MIHRHPPRLTHAQAHDCADLPVVRIATAMGRYLSRDVQESARQQTRKMLRETIGKDWSEGFHRVARAGAFGSALIDEIARTWPSVTVDARDVYVMLLMQDRIVRYMRLYGGAWTRATHDRIARDSARLTASSN